MALTVNGVTGRGECLPYARYGESVESVIAQIEQMRAALANGMTRDALQLALRRGGAKCAGLRFLGSGV